MRGMSAEEGIMKIITYSRIKALAMNMDIMRIKVRRRILEPDGELITLGFQTNALGPEENNKFFTEMMLEIVRTIEQHTPWNTTYSIINLNHAE